MLQPWQAGGVGTEGAFDMVTSDAWAPLCGGQSRCCAS